MRVPRGFAGAARGGTFVMRDGVAVQARPVSAQSKSIGSPNIDSFHCKLSRRAQADPQPRGPGDTAVAPTRDVGEL